MKNSIDETIREQLHIKQKILPYVLCPWKKHYLVANVLFINPNRFNSTKIRTSDSALNNKILAKNQPHHNGLNFQRK